MISPTDVRPWVERLKTACPILCDRVFLTVPDPSLTIDYYESPVAFVYLEQEDSHPNSLVNDFRQLVKATVTVELVIRRSASINDVYCDADAAVLFECRREILTALCGWLPDYSGSPVAHVTAHLSQKTEQVIKFIDRFSLTRFNRLNY